MLRRLLLLLTLMALVGCRMPGLVPNLAQAPGMVTAQDQTQPLKGRVETGAYRTQATLAEIGNGATVSLIDPTSGNTLATTISDASGSFQLNFGTAFVPVSGQAYYLQAMKGIKGANSQFNQAGSDALRLRSLVFFQASGPKGWKSLSNATPGEIALNKQTTALSVALALKIQAGESLNLNDYIGALAVTPYVSVGAVSDADFNALLGLVSDAVDQDRDPIQYTVYDTVNHRFSQSWVGFSITDVTPKSGNINDTITVTGSGFTSGAATVSVNGVPATILTLANDTITARVSPGSRTGPVSVQIGATLQAGPTFAISVNDGHRAYLNGKLYVANPNWGTVSEVAANGDVKTILTGLSSPMQVTAGPDDMLYVACKGANKVLKVDPSSYAQTDFASIASAAGLAFDPSGNLYVASSRGSGAGAIVKVDPFGGIMATYTGFTNPTSLGFDYAGMLYVVEAGGTITKLTPAGSDGAPRTPWGMLSNPMGMAIDSGGNLYIASNGNNAIYRIDASRNVTVFQMINKPGGLCFDSSGNLYVSDTDKNLIYRLSLQGNLKTYAYGISNPRGLAVDPVDGTIYVSLNQSNAILKVNPANGVLKPFVTGIANPLTLNFRDNGLFIAHPDTNSISYANRQGDLSTVVTGVTEPGGADKDVSTGKIYVGRYGIPFALKPDRSGQLYGGYQVVSGGTVTTVYPSLRQGDNFLAIDASDVVYAVNTGNKTLTRYTYLSSTGYQSQTLYTFANTPGMVAYDAAGNLYVPVAAENAVYRFDKAASYARTVLTGFSQPWGLVFDGSGVLYVSNPGDGKLRRVTTPATATAADTWTSVVVGTGVRGLAHQSGTLYMADGTSVTAYSIAGNSVAPYTSGLPRSISTLWVKPDLTMYAYADSTYAYTISPGKVVSAYIDMTGWSRLRALGFDPSWRYYRTLDYDAVIGSAYGAIGHQSYSHEILLDGDRLYESCPDAYFGNGGVTRYDLTTGIQYQYRVTGNVFSLAVSAARDLYVGASNNLIYQVNLTNGANTQLFDLGTIPYGLDIYGSTLWAVGANNRLFEMPIGGAVATRYFGLMEPTF